MMLVRSQEKEAMQAWFVVEVERLRKLEERPRDLVSLGNSGAEKRLIETEGYDTYICVHI
jgi:hypothetical protein